jgi:hypothetical protein
MSTEIGVVLPATAYSLTKRDADDILRLDPVHPLPSDPCEGGGSTHYIPSPPLHHRDACT